MLTKQGVDGQFNSTSTFEGPPAVDTAFALLFLSKGKRQIVVSRLEYDTEVVATDGDGERVEDWNIHRQAMQHLTMATESVWKRELAWQTVDVSKTTMADLLETPVLFISGRRSFRPARPQEKLRSYVEQGGFILEACNQDSRYDDKVKTDSKNLSPTLLKSRLRRFPQTIPFENI